MVHGLVRYMKSMNMHSEKIKGYRNIYARAFEVASLSCGQQGNGSS